MLITQRLYRAISFVLIVVFAIPLVAREPLPVDQGKTGLLLTLRRLRTTARLMHTAAHPDDEDGGMLTLESRGRGAYVVQMTLTRGEGGQNAVGKELGDELGILRTLELLEADRYYGTDQRFSRVADFGFSRSAEETIRKWNGRETALADLVRVIRTLKPDVVISRFIGDPSDGHGNHQASGILTREAFRAAGDPSKFPDQITEGLQPFQPKKLYVRARGDDWNVELDVNQNDPLLGMSYVAWAFQGLKHQLSQGAANWQMPTRMFTSHYKLVDTTIPNYKPGREKDFFDGIDTSLPALANVAPNASTLKPGLAELASLVDEASAVADKDQKAAAIPLLKGFAKSRDLIAQVEKLPITPAQRQELTVALETKRDQFRDAANLALGVTLTARADLPAIQEVTTPEAKMWLAVVPGNEFSRSISTTGVTVAGATMSGPIFTLTPSEAHPNSYNVKRDAHYTRQYWHRDDQDRGAIYQIDDPQYQTLPLTPWPFVAHATYEYQGQRGEVVSTLEVAEPKPHPLIIGPGWSLRTSNATLVVPAKEKAVGEISTALRSNFSKPTGSPEVRLTDSGFAVIAPQVREALVAPTRPAIDVNRNYKFTLTDASQRRFQIHASIGNNQTIAVGYSVVTRNDLGTAYYFRKSAQPVSVVDVKIPADLKVGYIMGVGDDIPEVLKSVGVNVTTISADELKTGDLSKYNTIVLGIRAYDSRADVRENNPRLLDYVKNGGTLMVQYVYDTGKFNEGNFAPYPFSLDRNNRDRVVNEEAPVTILAPESPVFKTPNPITPNDFTGWVQERALYSPASWDSHYQPLLLAQDSDGPPIKGGLLVALYGKGIYIWNSWAFFRQLPAGVPGAIRLYVNLLSLHGQSSVSH